MNDQSLPLSTPNGLYRLAVVGNPNCGKSALFNALTGLRQKVANYPGATVERRVGRLKSHEEFELVDLPGTYSLKAKSPDEQVTRDMLLGYLPKERRPDLIIAVIDATNIAQHLTFILELMALQLPMVVALNMTDLAAREKIVIDSKQLSLILGLPVIETVAVRRQGLDSLLEAAKNLLANQTVAIDPALSDLRERQRRARDIARTVTISEGVGHRASRVLDRIFLHPLFGLIILYGLLFLMFQAVFSWAEVPKDFLEEGMTALQLFIQQSFGQAWYTSLLVDGVIAGMGAVIVFLPQIMVLFAFILALESTGYMARAAFLMDRLMARVGLNGRAFIPLLSSFACAVPGIMAARTIADPKDRMTTILIAPLMTCSARLPVYTLIIAAFIPNDPVLGFSLQGLVMFGLYLVGVVSALLVALIFRKTLMQGASQPFLMELPKYQLPDLRFVLIGLYERCYVFLRRAGTIILSVSVILWLLASYPFPPEAAELPDIAYSFVGRLGSVLESFFAPIGFNWEISVALVPGLAAREVAVAALGTVYSLSGDDTAISLGLASLLQQAWSLPTALSFLAWYIFAPQCISTIAITRRETNSWRWPLFMVSYLFGLAYLASFLTYRIALWFSA